MKKFLILIMVFVLLVSLSSCSFISKTKKSDSDSQSEDSGFLGDLFSDEETTEERDVVSASFDLFSDFEGINFSEGLAFSLCDYVDSSGFYFDKTGEVAFKLDPGFNYGYKFNEGYAVISTEDKDGFYWDIEDAYSAVVDKKGNYLFEGGEHNFYGKVSEGKIVAYDYVESYNGTVIRVTVYDLQKNALWSEEFDYIPSFGSFYLDDIMVIGNKCYDTKGNVVFEAEENINLLAGFSELSDVSVISNDFGILTVFDRKNLEVKEYEFPPSWGESFDGTPFSNGYLVGYTNVYGKGLYQIDKNGNLTVIDFYEEYYIDLEQTDDEAWILKMENGFFTIIDKNGNFLFEPVQNEIIYLGEGLFQIGDGSVCDKTGKEIYNLGHSVTNNDGTYYSDGMLVAKNSNTYRSYVDKEGNELSEAWTYLDVLYS